MKFKASTATEKINYPQFWEDVQLLLGHDYWVVNWVLEPKMYTATSGMLLSLTFLLQSSNWGHSRSVTADTGRWFGRHSDNIIRCIKLPTMNSISTEMTDCLWLAIPLWYVTTATRSTQPCIPLGLLYQVTALIGWGNNWNVTTAGWQVATVKLAANSYILRWV